MDVIAADIAVHHGQARHAEYCKVQIVTHLPGTFLGQVVAGVVAVVGQGAAAGAVDLEPAIVATDFLQAHIQGVALVFGRQQGVGGSVVEVTRQFAAVVLAPEITEVGSQCHIANRLAVQHV